VSLVLEFDQDSWTKLDADGETLFKGLIRRGETKRFEARGELRISLGNAGAVRVTVNGHAIDSLGKAGQVVRDLPIPVPTARGCRRRGASLWPSPVPPMSKTSFTCCAITWPRRRSASSRLGESFRSIPTIECALSSRSSRTRTRRSRRPQGRRSRS